MVEDILLNLKLFAPESILIAVMVLLFLVDAIFPRLRSSFVPLLLVIVGCIVSAWCTYFVSTLPPTLYFSGFVASDPFNTFFRYLFLFACAVGSYIAYGSKELEPGHRVEFLLLLLCVTFGLCLMSGSTHLLGLYIGIETVSIVSFVMAGLNRENLKSNEASFKYFVFGALASGLMLYGFSLIYGYTGSLYYGEIANFLVSNQDRHSVVLILAILMTYAGLAYKISSFPMHFWTPDVYEGAPTPITTFFAIGPKAAGFAALVRILVDVFASRNPEGGLQALTPFSLVQAIALLSAITMTLGNLSAISQKNVKRMLAYSSIAHVGYMLMGVVSLDAFGLQAILFYLLAYCAMNLGAFWVASIMIDVTGQEDVDAFRGLGWSMPVLGVCMAIFLFSLTGIPLFAGFVGKFLLFAAVIKTPGFLWLAILAVL
ncbi:MAG: NADH-quinone oxidoreductase subunit N, partial [Deltaproteobacteria bacterium]|nr:NADH-quinone oxidoreductase subunit N [Deltaproteobacteria bacterium]